MLFQSWTFGLFFAGFYPVYLAVRKTRLRVLWLLAASYVFYGWLNPLYPLLVLWCTAVDYLAVTGMAKTRFRRSWLLLSLASDLGVLGFFKYAGFVVETINAVLGPLGAAWAIPKPGVLLPVGLSFFVFQSLTYTIGFYRGEVERETSFLRYAAFVACFAQLLAGPIERARNILPQLRGPAKIAPEDVADGLSLFVVGLFKKVVLADWLALYVDKVYGAPSQYEAPALLLATLAFSWQIYFDFSGYTDMARGVARAIGIRLMLNFNHPYLATGLGDFWRRWHISLSTWFRDYVYLPLGGNRHGVLATYRNMFLTMVISGLWHGATWGFVLWGAVHGLGRVLTRRMEESAFYRDRVPRAVKTLWVFSFVTLAWVFFRAEGIGQAWAILSRIAQFGWADPAFPWILLVWIIAVWAYQALCESPLRAVLRPAPVRIGLMVLLILAVAIFAQSGTHEFIYFQF